MSKQLKEWENEFGKEYTKRNLTTPEGFDELYAKRYGITRTLINKDFLDFLDKDIKILEVGANVGHQLNLLSQMGFKNLYGIEINSYAIEVSRKINSGLPIYIIKASSFDIPFKDGFFDLVLTSGVLIHIHPKDIKIAMKEIHRCSKKYICGLEYFSDNGYEEVGYRGKSNMLWKTDFKKLYLDTFPDLKLIKEELFSYIKEPHLKDQMFLLGKSGN